MAQVIQMPDLIRRCQRRVDMEYSDFIVVAEWEEYIQKSYERLHNKIVGKYEDYFCAPGTHAKLRQWPSGTAGIAAGVRDYSFPARYFKLLAISIAPSSGSSYSPLGKVSWQQALAMDPTRANGTPRFYVEYGRSDVVDAQNSSGLRLVPAPDHANYQLEYIYVPTAPDIISEKGATFSNGWDEWVVLDACIKARDKQESDTRVLQVEREEWWQSIIDALSPRDGASPYVMGSSTGVMSEDLEEAHYD